MIAAQEDHHGAGCSELGVIGGGKVGDVGHGFDLMLRLDLQECADLVNGPLDPVTIAAERMGCAIHDNLRRIDFALAAHAGVGSLARSKA